MAEFLALKTGGAPEGCDCSPRATSDVIFMDRGRPDKLEFEDGGDERFEDPNGTPTRIAMTIPPAASFLTDRPLILGDVLATTSSIWACFQDLKGPFIAIFQNQRFVNDASILPISRIVDDTLASLLFP
jgi:hypothetical protein